MKRHLNTLFITTQGAYLAKDGETVLVRIENQTRLRVPIHNLGGLVCFGNVLCSPFMLGMCAEHGVMVSFLTARGKFLARVEGEPSGNVLLRREQYRRADDPVRSTAVARALIQAKIANARAIVMRARRDRRGQDLSALDHAARRLRQSLAEAERAESLDVLRGVEGSAARAYFAGFNDLIIRPSDDFSFTGRNRRPPKDRINALLSFLYTLLRHDVASGLMATGLDPSVGFLHRDRPGRPGLALDLMEELRPVIADRLAFALVNRKQIGPKDFRETESGGVYLNDAGRKAVIKAYQKRKDNEIKHPFLGEKMTLGLVFQIQALLLARYLRGDLDAYPPFLLKA